MEHPDIALLYFRTLGYLVDGEAFGKTETTRSLCEAFCVRSRLCLFCWPILCSIGHNRAAGGLSKIRSIWTNT